MNALNNLVWLVANKDVPRSKMQPTPEPYILPGMAVEKRPAVSAADLKAFHERTARE